MSSNTKWAPPKRLLGFDTIHRNMLYEIILNYPRTSVRLTTLNRGVLSAMPAMRQTQIFTLEPTIVSAHSFLQMLAEGRLPNAGR